MVHFKPYGYSYPMIEAASTPQELYDNFMAAYSAPSQTVQVEFTMNQVNPGLSSGIFVEIHALESGDAIPSEDEDSDSFVDNGFFFGGGPNCDNCDPDSTTTISVDITDFLEGRGLSLVDPIFIWAQVFDIGSGESLSLDSICLHDIFWVKTDNNIRTVIPISISDITTSKTSEFHCGSDHCLCNDCEVPEVDECDECEECSECEEPSDGNDETLSMAHTQVFMSPETIAMSVAGVGLIFLAAVMFK
eukprot:TRINITY_DN3655_c0_g1_i1.p1 TRINITY_DN3655_c0_g1~~TRINITY_DN3655_c0_g1_i1.p1  ORF type:complete len:247 (+),score=12.46 TRINITY_DN3655_c0_g1_i1:379-1119(+)